MRKNTDLIYLISRDDISIGYIRYHYIKHVTRNANCLEIFIFIQDNLNNKNLGSYTLQFFNLLFNDQLIVAEISKII